MVNYKTQHLYIFNKGFSSHRKYADIDHCVALSRGTACEGYGGSAPRAKQRRHLTGIDIPQNPPTVPEVEPWWWKQNMRVREKDTSVPQYSLCC